MAGVPILRICRESRPWVGRSGSRRMKIPHQFVVGPNDGGRGRALRQRRGEREHCETPIFEAMTFHKAAERPPFQQPVPARYSLTPGAPDSISAESSCLRSLGDWRFCSTLCSSYILKLLLLSALYLRITSKIRAPGNELLLGNSSGRDMPAVGGKLGQSHLKGAPIMAEGLDTAYRPTRPASNIGCPLRQLLVE